MSDRADGWIHNDRGPEFAVYLEVTAAKNLGTHWMGGPDFAVEIVAPDDHTWAKLPFYEAVGTRELLIIDRDPWRLELYQLKRNKLKLAGAAAGDVRAGRRQGPADDPRAAHGDGTGMADLGRDPRQPPRPAHLP